LASDVADGVDTDVEAQIAHPADDQIPPRPVVIGERQPAGAPTGSVNRADLGQRLEPGQQAGPVDPKITVGLHGRMGGGHASGLYCL